MSPVRLIVAVCGLHVLLTQNSGAALSVRQLGLWPGSERNNAEDAVYFRGRVYSAGEGGLNITDFTNPSKPAALGRYRTSGYAFSIAASDVVAAVKSQGIAGENLLEVVDVSNPASTHLIKSRPTPFGPMAISGNYLFLGGTNLVALDVAIPDVPEVGAFSFGTGSVDSLTVVDGIAAVVVESGTPPNFLSRVSLVDVSDPKAMKELGSVSGNRLYRAAIDGTRLAITGDQRFFLYDISNASSPQALGSVPISVSASGVAIHGSYAIASLDENGSAIIDLHDPARPTIVGTYPISDASPLGFTSSGTIGLFAIGERAFDSVDLSTANAPQRLALMNLGGKALEISQTGNLVAIADDSNGLQLIDVSNPALPVRVGFYGGTDADAPAVDRVALAGTIACILREPGVFETIDINNPASPQRLGALSFDLSSGYPMALSAVNSLAIVSVSGSPFGLRVIDIHDPHNPQELYKIPITIGSGSIANDGNRLAVTASDGIAIFDLDASGLGALHSVPVSGYQSAVAVAGDFVYSVGTSFPSGQTMLNVLNATAPIPTRAGSLALSNQVYSLSISGNRLFASTGDKGVAIIDVSDASEPKLLAAFDTDGDVSKTVATPDRLYVADGLFGLRVLELIESDPRVFISLSGNVVDLHWPTGITGFSLQSRSTLNAPWQNYQATPNPEPDGWHLSLPMSGAQTFYRLSRP